MMTGVEGFYGGLSALADALQVERIGPMHQAGSDSLLTAQTYFALVNKNMGGICDETKFRGELFGIGSNHTKYKNDRGMGNKVVQVLGQGISNNPHVYNNQGLYIPQANVSHSNNAAAYHLNNHTSADEGNQPLESY
jgi:CCR4-NOT transcription complex subunit 7/8